MTTGNARENFFLLLALNPDAPWSQATFEKALSEKRARWGHDSSSGVGQHLLLAQGYLRLIPEIKRVMNDIPLREVEASAARLLLEEQKRKRAQKFEEQLVYINAKSSLEQAELDKFVASFKDILSEDQIKARVTVLVGSGGGSSLPPQLDATTAQNIADRLSVIHMTSLYELLGPGTTTASIAELCRFADELFLKTVRSAHNEQDTAKKELAGYAKKVFETEEMRKKYDETLRQESLNLLLKKLDAIMSHAVEKDVQVGQVTLFLQDAQKGGWSPEEALARLLEHKRIRKWSMEVPTIDKKVQKIRCGNCSSLNGSEQKYCSVCKDALFFACPDCGHITSCEHNACGQCGFPVGNRYRVQFLLDEITLLFQKKGDWAEIARLVSEVEIAWQPKNPDALEQKIHDFRTRIDTMKRKGKEKQEEVSSQCSALIAQKHFFAARSLLVSFSDVTFLERELQKHTIDNAIAQAQALLKRAYATGSDVVTRIDLCHQALLICSDYQDARDLLTNTPPLPPQNLQAKVKRGVVSLSWQPSPVNGVTYHAIRKELYPPKDVKDGTVLGLSKGLTYDDATAEIGRSFYYAVYAEFDQVFSRQGAILAHSVLLQQEVSHLRAKASDGLIELSWKTPPNVANVCIVRKEKKPPISFQDGTFLAALKPDVQRFSDQKVENEHVYHYLVYCQFKDQDDRLINTAGSSIMATPETPPGPITHIDIEETKVDQTTEVIIRWERPLKGKVIILKADQPLKWGVGDMVAETDLAQYGTCLEDTPESVKDIWQHSGIAYYVPVVLVQKWAYVGTVHRYVCLDTISKLERENLGSSIRLHWLWPDQCREVIVSFSAQDWPHEGDAMTTTRRVSRAMYDQLGYYDITGILNQDYYISLRAVIKYGDEYVTTREQRLTGRIVSRVVLGYEIKRSTFLHKKYTLQIMPKQPGALPALLLIAKRGRLPMNKTDGDLLYRVDPRLVNGERIHVELPMKTFPTNTFGKLFLEDDHGYEVVIIHHPGIENLRLN